MLNDLTEAMKALDGKNRDNAAARGSAPVRAEMTEAPPPPATWTL